MTYRAYIRSKDVGFIEFVEYPTKKECINKIMELYSLCRKDAKLLISEWVKI